MKNLQEFRESHRVITRKQFETWYGCDVDFDGNRIHVYGQKDDAFHIVQGDDDMYNLIVERSSYTNANLAMLEKVLWNDFAKYEMKSSREHMSKKRVKKQQKVLRKIYNSGITAKELSSIIYADMYEMLNSTAKNKLSMKVLIDAHDNKKDEDDVLKEFELEVEFRNWIESDNVVRGNVMIDKYTTQCTQYNKVFTRKELREYFIKEYKS